MSFVYILGGIYCLAVFAYLVVALFAPEKF
jgi:K+-transporting ATPase KdpF subunit